MPNHSGIRTALARTYRPRKFAELATQEHVADTLRTAVQSGRVAHAYLFAGPRGVGKTTAARVLAMALNCPNRAADGEPCGECESCERIWSGKTSLDVVEIDAASNRGVDDARDLRERAMYAPTEADRWKVYIVDEAHMLTREAWNALLKILEEPPPRVIFIFATTEAQKIQQSAAPILSRTQRFDFRRITTQGIVARLKTVLADEHVQADEAALTAIARRADGGMRDALSLTDQVLSMAGESVRTEDVTRVLGLVSDELYLDLFHLLAERSVGEVFRFVQRVIDEGYDLAEFYRGLTDALRALIIAQVEGEAGIDVREDLRQAYAAASQSFARGDLLRMLSTVAELDADGRFRKSANPRTLLESLLLRWAYLDSTVDLEGLLRGKAPARPAAEPRRPVEARAPALSTQHPAPQAPHSALSEDAASAVGAQQALRAMKAPFGMGMFLKVARVIDERADTVVVELPEGPGYERLHGETAVKNAVEEALSAELGRKVSIEVRLAGGAPPVTQGATSPAPAPTRAPAPRTRITPESVKAEKLKGLANQDPSLGAVLTDWDLEMLD